MADYMILDRLTELWQLIDELHLSYLHADESPRKIEEKKRLEGHIKDYLSIAPHESKFCFPETRQVLRRSIQGNDDFSPYRATAAWSAIAAYAHNLLAQPWRKEFREIKTYCGFYKHHVEGSLIGGEVMLEMMGYRPAPGSCMVLDGPVDPDRVANVSKDSFLALVECQIIRSIYGELVKSFGDCTWMDVLQYRETHIGNSEQALLGLTYKLHQRRFHDQYSVMEGFNRYQHPMDSSYVPLPSHYCRFNANLPHGYSMQPSQMSYGALISPQQQLPPACPVYLPNGYHYGIPHNGYSPQVPLQSAYSCSVPTGQLIDLDAPVRSKEYHHFSSNTHRRSNSDHLVDREKAMKTLNDDYLARKPGKKDEGWDSWNYVYQSLESNKKATYKNETSTPPDKKPLSLIDLDDVLKELDDDDSANQTDAADSYLSEKTHDDKSKKLPCMKYDFSSSAPLSVQTLGRDIVRKSDNYLTLRVKLHDDKWECSTCTYHNPEGKEVCEMCGKSKNVGSEAQPLASGGRQCPQCTLVNEKGVITCDACGACLKDSPTYI